VEGAGAPSTTPLDAAEFETLMAPFAPFESAPCLAVAVSGGADSMALALLADWWANARGGAVTALIVDHRLRAESAREAQAVGRVLAARGIRHEILIRAGGLSPGNIEDVARRARYRLLESWCREHGVLHLLTAHHCDDQAETFLIRLARGSGLDGLAAMAAESARRDCRVLRPLLTVPRDRLRATAASFGVAVVADPMNEDPAFQRVRLRAARDLLAGEGLTTERLAATAERLARARAALATMVAGLLARAVRIDPLGFAMLDAAALGSAPEESRLRALAAVLATVGGAPYPPRFESLERLYRDLPGGLAGGRTLAGCRLMPKAKGVLVCREPAAVAGQIAAAPGTRLKWDSRFRVMVPEAVPAGLVLGALGAADAARIAAEGAGRNLPAAVRATLPGFFDAAGLAAVPVLGWVRAEVNAALGQPEIAVFAPSRPLSGDGFTVV
jgi:tRNA(Ile)-lysidine synthase